MKQKMKEKTRLIRWTDLAGVVWIGPLATALVMNAAVIATCQVTTKKKRNEKR